MGRNSCLSASPPPEHVKHAHVGAFYMFGGRGCRKGTQHENTPMQGAFSCWASRGVQRRVGRHPSTKIMPMGCSGGGMGIPTSRTRKTPAVMHILRVLEVRRHPNTRTCPHGHVLVLRCSGGWLVAEVGWRVEEEGSRTRKTRAVVCFSCSGGGWLQRWGAEVEGLGRWGSL